MENMVLLEDLLQEPVQEGSSGFSFAPEKAPPPVSMNQDYAVPFHKDCFMSSTAPPPEAEDLLDKVTNGSSALNPTPKPSYQRTASVDQLFNQILMTEDFTDGGAQYHDHPEQQQQEIITGMPSDLMDVECVEMDDFPTWMYVDNDQSTLMDAEIQNAMSGSWQTLPNVGAINDTFASTGSSTSSTNMALTYEVPSKQQPQVTQQPQLPFLKEEHQQHEAQLPKLSVFNRSKQPPQEIQELQQLDSPDVPVSDVKSELESPLSESSSLPSQKEAETEMETADPCEQESERMAQHIREMLSYRRQPTQERGADAKPLVHEVVLSILLHSEHCDCSLPLNRLLEFCDKEGHPNRLDRKHFAARDTKAVGSVWQKLKGNKNANFDTFARAMRVGRERSKGYFGYLESGKGSKKRVYRLESIGAREMKSMEEALALRRMRLH